MKYLLSLILILPVLVFSQNIEVTGMQQISRSESNNYAFPRFSPDGAVVYFTGVNFRGLWQYDQTDGTVRQINDYPGAGYDPQILSDRIVFRKDRYRQGPMSTL